MAVCGLGIPLWLDEDIEHVTIRIDGPPQPVFSANDRDDNFIQMSIVSHTGPDAPDTIGEMAATAP